MEAALAMVDGATCDLDVWLTPFLEVVGRKTRRTWAPFYVRGLLGPGERKSLQPMALQLGLGGHDQLQHFIASPAWDDGPLWAVLAREADQLVGGADAVLVIDDTALPKKGTRSVGVARQYCGQMGKRANCQALVSLTLAGREVPLPVGLRLFLPEEWVKDPARCGAACVPEAEILSRSKGEIALAELDRLRAGCSADLARRTQAPPQAGSGCPHGGSGPGRTTLAAGHLAARHQGTADGTLRRRAGARW
jgi:SRSO17 transposase